MVAVASEAAATLNDNFGNIYVPGAQYTDGIVIHQLFWSIGGATGVGQQWTVNSPGGFPAVAVAVFDGGPWSFEVQNGHGAVASTIQPGTVNPGHNNSIIVCGLTVGSLGAETIDSGFNISDQQAGVAGQAVGVASAYLIETVAAPVNPTWSVGGASHCATAIAVFFPAVVPPLTLACANSTAAVGVPYSSALVHTGGVGPYTYSIAFGSLPTGLSLNTSTGAITGTPTTGGYFPYDGRVVDSLGTQALTTGCDILVSSPLAITCPTSTGTVGAPYSGAFGLSGGTAPYNVTIIAGTFPPGLTLSPFDGSIVGFPTMAGAFSFTAQVQDTFGATATAPCTITILAISILCPAPTGSVGTPYSSTLTGLGGTPPYTYAITSGALPTGLNLNTSTGAITGTPTAPGPFSFTAQLTDSMSATATVNCTITIHATALTLACAAATAAVGVAYSSSLVAAGGTGPYTYAIIDGILPPGLVLNATTGAITGTPTMPGNFPYTARVTDSTTTTAEADCNISVAAGPLGITCASSAAAVGVPYSSSLMATGGLPPYKFSITSGVLPPGLALNPFTGAITGTPTVVGNFPYTGTVTDDAGNTKNATCAITVAPAALSLACVDGGAAIGYPYSSPLVPTGGQAPYAYAITAGALPPGLGLNVITGIVSGTPTLLGTFAYTATVTDSLGHTAPISCQIVVYAFSGLSRGINLVTSKQFAMIREKGLQGIVPLVFYQDNAFPNAGIHLWPVPKKIEQIEIRWWDALQAFIDTDAQLDFPEGFYDALVYNLAVQLAPSYKRRVTPDILGLAQQKKQAIAVLNGQILSGSFGEGETLEGPNIGEPAK